MGHGFTWKQDRKRSGRFTNPLHSACASQMQYMTPYRGGAEPVSESEHAHPSAVSCSMSSQTMDCPTKPSCATSCTRRGHSEAQGWPTRLTMPLNTQQTLDAYEAGIEAAFEHDVHHQPMGSCPFPPESHEAREWSLGVEHARGDRHIKNRRLRQLRRRLAHEGGVHTEEEWRALCAEFGFRCVRCGLQPPSLERDHIVPIYQRGTEAITNIQPLCKTCNTAKGPEDIDWVAYRRQHGFTEHVHSLDQSDETRVG